MAGVSLDPSGTILTSSLASPGSYVVGGDITDDNGDTGSWSVNLQVKVVLAQASSNTSDTVAAGTAYAGQLVVPNLVGTLSDNELAGDVGDISVSPTGAISAPATLAPGVYSVAGNMSDDNGDQGSWTFTLTVTLGQSGATSATTAFGAGYSGSIGVVDPTGSVSFTEDSSADSNDVVVDSSGNITATAGLAPGTYAVTGTMTDSASAPHSGTWQFTLTVASNGTLNQSSLAQAFTVSEGTTTVGAITTDSTGTVTYSEATSPSSSLVVVDSSGDITLDPSATPGIYTVVGSDYDTAGFSGTWVVTVTVEFPQTSPTSATVIDGAGYAGTLAFTGAAGVYTVSEFSPTYGISVDATGAISAPATLAAGTYPVAGYALDSIGNVSYWSFTLTVSPAPTPTPPAGVSAGALGTPTSGVVTSTATKVTLTSGSTSAAVNVPAGALPVGTALDIYPITNSSSLASSIPSGQSYLVSFAVAWKSPSGTVPAATSPITMTITDPAIVAGDSIYELTSTGVTKVGTASVNGSVTVTFTTDPTFVVAKSTSTTPTTTTTTTVVATPLLSITSGTLVDKAGVVALGLHCAKATCAGVAELVKVTTTRVKHGTKVTTKTLTAVLASSHYRTSASTSISVPMRVTSAGRLALAHAVTRPVAATVRVTVGGGTSRSKSVQVK